MYMYTSKQIKEIDSEAEQKGMSLFALMENAGNGLYHKIASLVKRKDRLVILAGKGNNGGDGVVLARYLKNNGYNVRLVFPLGESKTKTSIEHLIYYQACGFSIDSFSKDLQADWMIDALLGVGSELPLRVDLAEITDWINHQDAQVIAIDLPTGVSSDNGESDAHAVQADYTYSVHGYKPSTFLFPASDYYGEATVVDIGVPQTSGWKIWSEIEVRNTMPRHTGNTHKGTFGTGLLVAGSDEMPGSAALSAIGALRFGTGKLAIATTKHASTIIGPLAPEATFLYNIQASQLGNQYSCMAIGPGLNPDEELEVFILEMLKRSIPIILDAGALSDRKYQQRSVPTVITPHPGEFSRLTGKRTIDIQKNRITLASEYAKENGVIVVLKGKYTVIAFPDGTGTINLTGNRALSKGGTGDTLTGMLLASIGTHKEVKSAIANAVYVHGICADEWVKFNGEQTLAGHDFDRLLPEICCRYT
ncbi:NAD(P)H-hydrate dehydratase [Bacillus sp. V3B]|uniref:NAD(P)H-hydrate dehydratase n=1 Tax=Bacillus sp. V3B TaxID=2804915 RepID=UPI00210DD8BE|nr:NAD(P)H-hydrate dehydratase [Bacillus sp. V3B]MCQ6276592.1 NAD(P)H-hydrate dehydratase [Bacillus sp. V3B]